MRILLVHNFYQHPGGEDQGFAAEGQLLEAHGHEVVRYTVHNDAIDGMSRLALVRNSIWNARIAAELAAIVRQRRIEVAHFHNTFPLISPAAYSAVRSAGAAVVQTLHNFRLICLNAVLFREGRVCEDCIGRLAPWPGVLRGCYRDSRAASAVVASVLLTHRAIRTWQRNVDVFLTPSQFAARKLIAGGAPVQRLRVYPNFVRPDPGVGNGEGGYALYVGRFSPGKGVSTLLEAWRHRNGLPPLKVIGDGPLAADVREAAALGKLEWLGRRAPAAVFEAMKKASCVVVTSECYETFGRVAVEAFACGTPVAAPDFGALAEIVEHGKTGRLFRASDPQDLKRQVSELMSDRERLGQMRKAARSTYESRYSGAESHRQLMAIYQQAIRRASPAGVPEQSSD